MNHPWYRPSPHPIPRSFLAPFALCLALLALPGAAPPVSDTAAQAPDTARAIGDRNGWIVSLAVPCRDTLDAPLPDVVGAAVRCLEADDWRVEKGDRARGDLVTAWKELRHPMAKILMGRVDARCAVAVRPIEDGRTMVVFQGALASRESLEGNPALRLAMNKYRDAAHDWQREVRGDLAIRRLLSDKAR